MIYLVIGNDEFAKNEYVENIKKDFMPLKKGINFILIDKDNISSLGEELTTYSFFSESKLIIVKVPKSKSKKSEDDLSQDDNSEKEDISKSQGSSWLTEELIEKLKNKIDNITIIFIDESSTNAKLSKIITSVGGKVENFNQKFSNNNWVIDFAKKNKFDISYSDSTYLCELCGNNKQILYNELVKLFSYCENGVISKKDIDIMCISSPELLVFDLTDSMGRRDIKASLKNLDDLLANKEAIQKLFVIIANHFMKLLITKELVEKRKDVASFLEIKEYPAKKYKEQASRFTKQELISIYKKFAKLDSDSKLSKMDLKIGLQKIIME